MDEIVINIEPIMQHIDFICATVGISLVLIIISFILGRGYQDKLNNQKDIHCKNKDVEMVTDAFAKIGEVKFGSKNEKILNAQNVQNNREIHSNNVRLDEQDNRIEKIEDNIAKILDMLERLQNKE